MTIVLPINRRKKEENDARYERSRSNATPSPPNSNFSSSKKDNSGSWEFDWSRQKSKNSSTSASDSSSSPQPHSEEDEAKEQNDSFSTNDSSPTGTKTFEDMFNVNSIYNSGKNFECHYCYKRLTDKEDLLSHQSICKRLSSNRIKNKYYSSKPTDFYPAKEFSSASATAPASSHAQPMTECVKCKVSMSTYDYLLHHCNDSTATKNKSERGPESRANLHSAGSTLSSSSFKYAYRHKPSLESMHRHFRFGLDLIFGLEY